MACFSVCTTFVAKCFECTNKEETGHNNFRIAIIGDAIIRHTPKGWREEQIFGMISPNNKRTSTSTSVNPTRKAASPPSCTTVFAKKKFSNTINATFIKLFEINKVAKRRSESSFNEMILLSDARLLSSTVSKSAAESEKKAFSDAEIKAEHNKNKSASTKAATAGTSGRTHVR